MLPDALGKDRSFRRRLEREAKTISQLSNPHVCILYDIGSEDGIDFLVMEYLDGETLEQRTSVARLSSSTAAGIR